MATGDNRVNIYNRRYLSLDNLSVYMYDNLRTLTLDIVKAIYTTRGVFSGGTFSSASADSLSITAVESLDTYAHFVNLSSQTNISFANVLGTTYYVGIKYIESEVPYDTTGSIEISPFLGSAQYRYYEENTGEIGNPDLVIDNEDGTITMTVDSIVGTSDNSGRSSRVWLTSPISANSGWYETCTIQYGTNAGWSGSKNYITTVGDFHQTDILGAISETTTNYRFWMFGVTITTTNITNDTNYIFLGTVLGNGGIPVGFDQSGINSIPSNLDSLWDKLEQLYKEYYGDLYLPTGDTDRSNRGLGLLTSGDTTPDIGDYRRWLTNNSIATDITILDNGYKGDIRNIFATDLNTTLKNSASLRLLNSVDYIMTYSDSITLLCIDGTNWMEIGRTEGGLPITTSSSTSSSSTSSSSTSSTSSSTSSSSTNSSSSSISSSSSTSASSSSSSTTITSP